MSYAAYGYVGGDGKIMPFSSKPTLKRTAVTNKTGPASIVAEAGDFHLLEEDAKPRLIINIEGTERTGRTHFALTAPDPIYYHRFDVGLEGVGQKFRKQGKEIHVADYVLKVPRGADVGAIAQATDPLWVKFRDNYYRSLESARTVVIDTASEQWETLRMARFGKLTQVMPHHYAPVNAEYRQIIKDAYNFDANLILIHKMKAEWAEGQDGKGRKTGKFERAGFAGVGFEVQMELQAWKEDVEGGGSVHHVTVLNCRQNPMIDGMDFVEPGCGFADIAMMVNPESREEDWK